MNPQEYEVWITAFRHYLACGLNRAESANWADGVLKRFREASK